MEIKIIATTGRARGQAVEIRAAKFFIGRHDNCQIRPNIPDLAGIHALIEQREFHVYLRDFGAEGGTGINDRVLHARETEVFDSDLIQIGPMVLTLSIKPKGAEPTLAIHNAPDGWPFLEDAEIGEFSEAEDLQAVPRPTHRQDPAQPTPSKVETFLSSRPASQPGPISAPTASPVATLAAQAPASPGHVASTPSAPSKAILNRPVNRRALACEVVDGVMVVTILSADLNEEETVSPVRYELRTLLEEDKLPSRMVVDLGNTKYLSSRAVGVLLAHYQGLERKGASMRVCGVSKEIKPVLDQMRLSMLIDIYPTVEEAVKTAWD